MEAQQAKETTPTSILMLPWVGYGHLSAYLELAKALSRRNFHIYYCSTPVNIEAMKPKLEVPSSIQFVELHLPSSDDFPPHLHTTNGLPAHLMPALRQAFAAAAPLFEAILQTLCPHLLIYDSLQPWAPKLASSLKIPALNFNTTGVFIISHALHAIHHPDSKFPLSDFVPHNYWKAMYATTDGATSERTRRVREAFLYCLNASCNAILINTFRELEGEYIDYLSLLMNKKVIPIGPLAYVPNQDEDQDEEEYMSIKNWLDKKEPSSTVFVSFGSECIPSNEEMEEIAHGLEQSGANFVWVVRFPQLENGNRKMSGVIEEGLLERGMVIQKWAPQARILRHGSIGGFVSHCGWNSVIESIMCGVPVIGLPMCADQPFNAGLLEEAGVGVEAKRDPDGKIQRHEIAKSIKEVVVDKTREDVRKRVREMGEILRRKGDEKIDEMVAEISQLLKL